MKPDPRPDPRPDFVLQTFIRTTREKLWTALTDEETSRQFHFLGAATRTSAERGGPYNQFRADGALMIAGEIISIEPMKRLEVTFEPHWTGEPGKVSRVIYEIESVGEACCLTVSHFDLVEDHDGVADGWNRQISALKTFLETGSKLPFAA